MQWNHLRKSVKWVNISPVMLEKSLLWRHNELDVVSDHQPHDCLLNRLFSDRSKETSKFRVTDLCAGNSPGTGELPAQRASNAEDVSIWWRHHVMSKYRQTSCISCTESQHLNVSRLALQLSLPNPWKPGVKSRMRMWLELRRQAMLQINVIGQQFWSLIRCDLY